MQLRKNHLNIIKIFNIIKNIILKLIILKKINYLLKLKLQFKNLIKFIRKLLKLDLYL